MGEDFTHLAGVLGYPKDMTVSLVPFDKIIRLQESFSETKKSVFDAYALVCILCSI